MKDYFTHHDAKFKQKLNKEKIYKAHYIISQQIVASHLEVVSNFVWKGKYLKSLSPVYVKDEE